MVIRAHIYTISTHTPTKHSNAGYKAIFFQSTVKSKKTISQEANKTKYVFTKWYDNIRKPISHMVSQIHKLSVRKKSKTKKFRWEKAENHLTQIKWSQEAHTATPANGNATEFHMKTLMYMYVCVCPCEYSLNVVAKVRWGPKCCISNFPAANI